MFRSKTLAGKNLVHVLIRMMYPRHDRPVAPLGLLRFEQSAGRDREIPPTVALECHILLANEPLRYQVCKRVVHRSGFANPDRAGRDAPLERNQNIEYLGNAPLSILIFKVEPSHLVIGQFNLERIKR